MVLKNSTRISLVAILTATAGFIAGSLGWSVDAFAYRDVRKMTCAAAAQLVASQGNVRLTYSSTREGFEVYENFNDGNNRCVLGELAKPAWVATLDTPQCFIGYNCRPNNK